MSFKTAIRNLIFESAEPKQDQRANLEDPTTSLSSPAAFATVFPSADTSSGELVSEQTALNISTVYTCVRIIAENIGSLPLQVKQTTSSGTRIANDHSLAFLLCHAPNPEMSVSVFLETFVANMALTGNGYAEIIRAKSGDVLELYPRAAQITSPVRLKDGSLAYEITESSTTKRTVAAANMLHVPLFGLDGLKGLSPIGQQRGSLGLTIAAQKHGSRYFGNGSRPGGLLTSKGGSLNPAQAQILKDSWEQLQGGINQGRIAVLPGDFEYTALGLSNQDSQFLETRAFQRAEIASWYRIPTHMVGDTTRMSNSNHEQASLSLIQDCLLPYLNKITAEMQRKLLPPTGRMLSQYSIAFDLTERLKPDLQTTLQAISVGRQWGIYSINDGRRILNLDPIGPQGDVYLEPVNMLDAEKFADWTPQQPAPKPTEQKSYAPLIRDGLGRLATRQNRPTEAFQSIFGPTLQAIADSLITEARERFNLPVDWTPNTPKIIADCLKSVEHRSASWSHDHEATAADETQRIYKALRTNIWRDAAAADALKDIADAA